MKLPACSTQRLPSWYPCKWSRLARCTWANSAQKISCCWNSVCSQLHAEAHGAISRYSCQEAVAAALSLPGDGMKSNCARVAALAFFRSVQISRMLCTTTTHLTKLQRPPVMCGVGWHLTRSLVAPQQSWRLTMPATRCPHAESSFQAQLAPWSTPQRCRESSLESWQLPQES